MFRYRRVLALAVTLLVVVVTGAPGADAQSSSGRVERERVRRQQAAVAAQLDVLRADGAKVDQALADLQARLESRAVGAGVRAAAAA